MVLLAIAAGACGVSTPTGDHPSAAPATTASSAGEVVDKVTVGGQPCGVTDAQGAIWVSDADGARLLRIDPESGKSHVAARLDPTPCEITPAFGSLWVVTQSGRVDRVDPDTGRVVARIKVGSTSYQAVATPGTIWVSNRNDSTLTQIDPDTNTVVRTVQLDGVQPGGMTYAGGSLWIGDDTSGDNEVLRMDPQTRRITKVTAGDRPAYLTSTPGAVWVSNVSDGTVSRIDIATNKETASPEVGLSPVNLKSRGTDEVWVPDDIGNAVIRIDAGNAEVAGKVNAEGGPAVVRAAFGDVWVTMFGIGEVWRIRPA